MSDETYDYSALLRLMEGGGGVPVQNPDAVDAYGGQMTDLNKQAGLATDWDFLAQNPGLIEAGGLSDITTYSPLELRFEPMASAYRMSDDPRISEIMSYVDAGIWSPQAIAEDIAKETGAKVEDVDTAFIESAINALSQAQLDDAVAKQGAELMVDSDGVEKWMKGETREHPFLEHARDLGYASDPRDTYDPYSIAPVGQRERDIETVQRYSDEKLASEDAMRAYSDAAAARFDREDRSTLPQVDPGLAHKDAYRIDAPTPYQRSKLSARVKEQARPAFGPGSTSMGRGQPAVAWTPADGGAEWNAAGLSEIAARGLGGAPRTSGRWAPSDEEYAALGRASREAGLAAWLSDAQARTGDSQAQAREQV